jgi:PAS domain S-box-containing protein
MHPGRDRGMLNVDAALAGSVSPMSDPDRSDEHLQRLAAIVDSSDDAIASKTLAGIVTSWNAAAERMFGYTADEVIGRPITILFPPDRLDEEVHFIARIVRGERVEHFETVRIRKDGRPIHVSVSLSPIRNQRGEIVGVSKIVRDMTERIQLTLREQAARREAEAANRMKDEFLAILSHELRTPLNAVFGWTRLLKMGNLDAATQQRAFDVISRNSQLQLDLINDLLDVSRIVTGRLALRITTLDLREVVEAAVEAARPLATEKGLTVGAICEPGTPPVIGDPERLQQVVSNLLNNALKFTPRGGWVRVRLYQAGSRVNLSVSDNGHGIEEKLLPRVFDRFRQADGSTSRSQGGLGLGLAIVRHIVELHGGGVRASSDGPGRGATFIVSLPIGAARVADRPGAARGAETASWTSPDTAPGPDLKNVRALVVDDERDSRELLAQILRTAGALVFTTGTTADALGIMVTERPDVVISDLGLPEEDGFTLITRIRALPDPELATVPTLACSAYARDLDRRHALAVGFSGYLVKPVDPRHLVDTVARLAAGA